MLNTNSKQPDFENETTEQVQDSNVLNIVNNEHQENDNTSNKATTDEK